MKTNHIIIISSIAVISAVAIIYAKRKQKQQPINSGLDIAIRRAQGGIEDYRVNYKIAKENGYRGTEKDWNNLNEKTKEEFSEFIKATMAGYDGTFDGWQSNSDTDKKIFWAGHQSF